MPTVLMTKGQRCSDDGINVVYLEKGERYNVSEKLAQTLVYSLKAAELIDDIPAPKAPPAHPPAIIPPPVDVRLPPPAAPSSKPVHVAKTKAEPKPKKE